MCRLESVGKRRLQQHQSYSTVVFQNFIQPICPTIYSKGRHQQSELPLYSQLKEPLHSQRKCMDNSITLSFRRSNYEYAKKMFAFLRKVQHIWTSFKKNSEFYYITISPIKCANIFSKIKSKNVKLARELCSLNKRELH